MVYSIYNIMIKKLTISLIVFFSLFIVTCDLFDGPKVDLYKAISDEVDWAHAEKLNVRIDFPVAWGTSVPTQGDITPARDLRKGYEFSVDFTPNGLYTLISWQVYLTSDLETVSGKPGQDGNWLEDLSLIDTNWSLKGNDVIPPTITKDNERGGTYEFIIYTTEPVTIVPWCDPQLRITRTEPRDIKYSSLPVSRASDIVLYFNGALNAGTVKFAARDPRTVDEFANDEIKEEANGIWISLEGDGYNTNNNIEKWFTNLNYETVGGFFTITMNSGAKLPPENCLMTVIVKGIKSVQGYPMDEAGYTFSWNTAAKAEVKLLSCKADYYDDKSNENKNSIVVSCEQEGATSVLMFYRLNGEVNTEFGKTDNCVITNVQVLSDTGVRNGMGVSSIMEYEISIELYAYGVMEYRETFKIWNFPGMSVSLSRDPETGAITDDKRAIEIKTAQELAAMNNDLFGQYVLANDISIPDDTFPGAWTPIGANGAPFRGKFYGNGNKITVNSNNIISTAYRGLFGNVQGQEKVTSGKIEIINAVIRDFTFEYNAGSLTLESISSSPPAIYIGGVAGYLKDTTVRNIITSGGTLDIGINNNSYTANLGGIAGYIEGSGKIENCRAELSVTYTSNAPGHTGDICIGAIAGEAGEGDEENSVTTDILTEMKINIVASSPPEWLKVGRIVILKKLIIDGVTVEASVTADKQSYGGEIYIGGAIGKSVQNTMNDIKFTDGKVLFSSSGNSAIYCGGIIGNSEDVNIADSSFSGGIEVTGTVSGETNLGGLVGLNNSKKGNFFINNCRIERINIELVSEKRKIVGGVLGNSYSWLGSRMELVDGKAYPTGIIIITNCFLDDGKIYLRGSGVASAGGFIGAANENTNFYGYSHYINNCGVLSGIVIVTSNSDDLLRAGGFITLLRGDISNCYSRIDVLTTGPGEQQVGGFCSVLNGTIDACYATGTVSSVVEGEKRVTIGGLVGGSGTINNSYSLGNVLVEKKSGSAIIISAGGLVGDAAIVKNCFSAGQVYAQTAVNDYIYSGGIIGGTIGSNGNISNTAALNTNVTVIGNNTRRYAGRINTSGTKTNNYALNSMAVEEGEYNATIPTLTPVNLIKELNAKDGADAASSTFLNPSFWKNTLKFSAAYWNFSRVAIDGYPRLAWEFQK
jgi:hypothetical protein